MMVKAMETNISFRVPTTLRDQAQKKAKAQGIKVSDVLRDALQTFVDDE